MKTTTKFIIMALISATIFGLGIDLKLYALIALGAVSCFIGLCGALESID